MLNSCFRDVLNILTFKAFATNSRSIQVFATTAEGKSDSSMVNLTLFRLLSQFYTEIDMTSLCEHHSLIIQNCLYIIHIIGHSNCEKKDIMYLNI